VPERSARLRARTQWPRLSVLCALAVTAVLLADGALVALRAGRSPEPSGPPTALDGVIHELEAFVERERGLPFLRPVRVELESDADFAATLRRLEGRRAGTAPTSQVFVDVLRALGLVEGPFDAAVLDAGADDEVLGFYDSGSRRLLVRGATPTPAVRRVLVHELTHALDDQHFGLERPGTDRRDDESTTAFAALVEGDAVRVESRYFDSLSPDERRQADVGGETGTSAADLPRVFEILLAFPYEAGEAFVDALVAAGGTARIDAAFGTPPATTEQVLHPQRFLGGEAAVPVPDPRADGRVVDRGVAGELVLRLVLAEALDRASAATAAEGWGGDRYVAWSVGARTCVRDSVVMDTPADRAELVAALQQWASRRPGATVADADPVVLTRCA
jgi:hypothetical protein